ncbi:MAG: PCRF domain-containing protein, partial [Chloroflexota bacterium]
MFDIAAREDEITRLEKQSAEPDLWSDPARAQEMMRQLAEARKTVGQWRGLEKRVADTAELLALASREDDASLVAEIEADVEAITGRLDSLDLELAFSGPYDARNAILAIHAGAGGTESQD